MKKNTLHLLISSLVINYLVIGWRSLLKNRLSAFISITGLVIGLSGSLLIGLFILDEVKYDQHFPKKESVYRITSTYNENENSHRSARTKGNIASILLQEFPEIETAARLTPPDEAFLFNDNTAFKETIVYTDSTFTTIFDINLLTGNAGKCLTHPSSIIISERIAKNIFGDQWQLKEIPGKTLSIDGQIPLTITGVFKDLPIHTHFRSDLFASVPAGLEKWMDSSSNVYTYILLNENTIADNVRQKLQSLSNTLSKDGGHPFIGLNLQHITDIHLFSSLEDENSTHGNINTIYSLLLVALALISITVINFVNLYTANSFDRLKEVGVRKSMGASNRHLCSQFMSETALITIIALCMAIVTAIGFLPLFNELTGKHISSESLLDTEVIILTCGLTTTICLLAGFYPALYLSAKKTTEALKAVKSKTTAVSGLRNGLVMLQFVISSTMIILSIAAFRQVELINNKPLGFDKENTIVVSNPYMLGSTDNITSFRDELLTVPGVNHISITGYTPSQTRWGNPLITFPDKNEQSKYKQMANWLMVDEGFVETMGLSLTSGRNFMANHELDKTSVIINQKAADQFNLNSNGRDAVGAELSFKNSNEENYQTFKIVGVVSDFNFGSLHEPVKPVIMKLGYHRFELAVRLSPLYPERETIGQIEQIWKKRLAIVPFEYSFIKKRFENLHRPAIAASKLFSIFCVLTVIMSALGLFSIVTYTIANRTKEIGIRKVLGASEKSIIILLTNHFLKLVVVSYIIALPLAWMLVDEWMNDFAYKTEITWWIYGFAGLVLFIVTILTLGYRSVKVSLSNPIDNLRHE